MPSNWTIIIETRKKELIVLLRWINQFHCGKINVTAMVYWAGAELINSYSHSKNWNRVAKI